MSTIDPLLLEAKKWVMKELYGDCGNYNIVGAGIGTYDKRPCVIIYQSEPHEHSPEFPEKFKDIVFFWKVVGDIKAYSNFGG